MSENNLQCTNCLKKLDKLFINCNECQNVTLCLGCFCNGVEAGLHKKHHGYSVKTLQIQNHVVFEGWTDSEELKLLDAIEQYGVGNWEDVSLKVESKSPEQCLTHYCTYYLNGLFGQQLLNSSRYPSHVTDHTGSTNALSPTLFQSPSLIQLDLEDQHLLGYMPYRDDFERVCSSIQPNVHSCQDYDNDAESILCRLHPSFSHDDLEDALKVAQVTIYLQRLRERQRRKEIAREHGLIPHILAFILNKRVKKRYKKNFETDHIQNRRGRPPSGRKTPISKSPKQSSPLKRSPVTRQFSDTSAHSEDEIAALPPPGSWLAVPFVLQAYGAKRGTPLVVNGLPDVHSLSSLPSTVNNVTQQNGYNVKDRIHSAENMNVFFLSEKLKPFLRYFTGTQAEELLKHEIKHLLELRTKGKVKLNAFKFKFPAFRSSVYCPPPKNSGPTNSRLDQVNPVKKKRRNPTTPWYLKVQRKAKQLR